MSGCGKNVPDGNNVDRPVIQIGLLRFQKCDFIVDFGDCRGITRAVEIINLGLNVVQLGSDIGKLSGVIHRIRRETVRIKIIDLGLQIINLLLDCRCRVTGILRGGQLCLLGRQIIIEIVQNVLSRHRAGLEILVESLVSQKLGLLICQSIGRIGVEAAQFGDLKFIDLKIDILTRVTVQIEAPADGITGAQGHGFIIGIGTNHRHIHDGAI